MSLKTLKYLAIGALFLLSGTALGACEKADDTPQPPRRVAREVNTLFADLARMELVYSPETASELGLEADITGYTYAGVLDDRSQAGWEKLRLARLDALERLEHAPLPPLGSRLRTDFDTVLAAYASSVRMAEFGHGLSGLGYAKPYVFDQLSGAYIDVPALLTERQSVRNREDALAYLGRLSGLAGVIEDQVRRLEFDAQSGISPPDFILDRMIAQAAGFASEPAETHMLVTYLENRMADSEGLDLASRDRFAAQARKLVSEDVLPAYRALMVSLAEIHAMAASEPGIWVLPGGEDYYDAVLNFYTGQSIPAEEMHESGKEMVAALTRELDVALIEAGLEEGNVGTRLALLNVAEGQVYENTPEGRALLVSDLNVRLETLQARLGEVLARPPSAPVIIARVPEFTEGTAPGGYYQSAAADGSTPGIFYINLRDTAEWPAYTLPTLVFHEAAPGHHVESAVSTEAGDLTLVRQLIWQPAYGEGWALYAEDLDDEMGIYDDDPLARIGYLQSVLFRAARVVTDTGIHRMRWSREEAVNYLVDTTGQPRSSMETEVDRYAVWPGQAVSYMAGRERIQALRDRARGVLGNGFDLAAFNHAILSGGPRPLDILERDLDAWVSAQLPD